MPYYIFPPDVLANPPSCHTKEQQLQQQSTASAPTTKHSLYEPITLEHEHHNRTYGALLIATSCQCLQLSSTVTCTAQNIYHRFYCLQPQQHYSLLAVILVCIGLASQLEEQIRTPTQIFVAVDRCIKLVHIQVQSDSSNDAADVTAAYRPLPVLQRTSRRYEMFKRLYEQTEMAVLRILNFTLYVQHPHSFLLHFINVLTPHMDVNHANVKYRQLAQLSWNTCNDLMLTVGPVIFKPADLTVAAIYTSAQVLELVFPQQWYLFFDCQLATIEAILQLLKEVHKLTGDNKQRILRYRPLSDGDAATNPLMFSKPIVASQSNSSTPAPASATVVPHTANDRTDLRSPSSNSVVSIDSVSSTPSVNAATAGQRPDGRNDYRTHRSSNGSNGHRRARDDRRSSDRRPRSRDRSRNRDYSTTHVRERSRDRYDDRHRYR